MSAAIIVNSVIRHLPANTAGRDFVVGDLHGCLDLLNALMARIGFDADRDRLFSVGDLVDRGHASLEVLGLLRKPWFHAVRGNHEQMMVDFFRSQSPQWIKAGFLPRYGDAHHHSFLQNGGSWVIFLDGEQMADVVDLVANYVDELPFIISVGEGAGRFNVVHAFLDDGTGKICNTDLDNDRIYLPDQIEDFFDDVQVGDMQVWLRRDYRDKNAARMVNGLSPTYCGHSILDLACEQRIVDGHINLDAGAFKSERSDILFGLVMTEPATGRVFVATGERENITVRETTMDLKGRIK